MKLFNWLFNENADDEFTVTGCPNAQAVANKYGYHMTCPEDEVVVSQTISDPYCANAQQVASKHGYNIVCPE